MVWDKRWEDTFKVNAWGKYPDEYLIRFIARHFYPAADRSAIKILEVGCGPGANIWYLAREGFSAYGIDASKTAIGRARSRLKAEGLQAHLKLGDIMNMNYPAASFDAVIDNQCLSTNSRSDTQKIFQGIQKLLKPEGLFYSKTFGDDCYVGSARPKSGGLEYTNISDGPLAGHFIRLTNKKDIRALYGAHFDLMAIDKLKYTRNNGTITISEWVIVSQNRL